MKKIFLLTFYLIILQFLQAGISHALEPRIVDAEMKEINGNITVNFKILDCFTESLNKAILNGIPVKFKINIIMTSHRSFIWDNTETSANFTHTITYDLLKKEFTVRCSENLQDTPKILKDFKEARDKMATVTSYAVMPIKKLVPATKYKIMIKANLKKVKFPLYLHYILFFVSLWDFETPWHEMNFTY